MYLSEFSVKSGTSENLGAKKDFRALLILMIGIRVLRFHSDDYCYDPCYECHIIASLKFV